MNQELQRKLLDYLNNGEAFIREQAPDFFKQAMAFYYWENHFWFWACLIIAAGMIGIAVLFFLIAWSEGSEGFCFLAVIISGLAILPFCQTFCAYAAMKKMELAPKLYLVNELAHGRSCK